MSATNKLHVNESEKQMSANSRAALRTNLSFRIANVLICTENSEESTCDSSEVGVETKVAQIIEHPTGYWKTLGSYPDPKSMNFLSESFVFIKTCHCGYSS